jgi:acetyl-CoA C-acetyltransferase
VMKEAVKRTSIDPGMIDDVRFGNMYEHHTSMNLARVASLQAKIPSTSTAVTIIHSVIINCA